jgi:hypothetical protein
LDPKIKSIYNAFRIRKMNLAEIPNGIRLSLSEAGLPSVSVDFYALRSNPDHLRAKIRGEEALLDISDANLKKVRAKLQNALLGVANVGVFASLGRRGESHYYYAHITMSKMSTDLTLIQKGAQLALEELKGVEPGAFRKALDELGLARSSQVRLALTRIFRESADIEEMLSVVVQEAGVIAKSSDWRQLKDIKEQNSSSFLTVVIDILWKAVAKERLIKTLEDIQN